MKRDPPLVVGDFFFLDDVFFRDDPFGMQRGDFDLFQLQPFFLQLPRFLLEEHFFQRRDPRRATLLRLEAFLFEVFFDFLRDPFFLGKHLGDLELSKLHPLRFPDLVFKHFDFFVLDLHGAGDFRRDGMLWTNVVFFFSSSDDSFWNYFLCMTF